MESEKNMSNHFSIKRSKLFSLKEIRSGKSNIISNEEYMEIDCPHCKNEYSRLLWKRRLYVCPNCGYHTPISARKRIAQVIDRGTFIQHNSGIIPANPIDFPGYKNKVKSIQEKSGTSEAVITGTGSINGQNVEIAVMDSTFMMGSMGMAVGEKVTRAIEYAGKNKLPFVAFCASGGARMQEGMFSLMQMAKTAAAIEKFSSDGGFYLSVLTHPTMGGVSASFAMMGDIIIAEPGALIGFAGQRVIEQTIGEHLPKGFQRAEFQLEHGFADMIVPRDEMKKTIEKLLTFHNCNAV